MYFLSFLCIFSRFSCFSLKLNKSGIYQIRIMIRCNYRCMLISIPHPFRIFSQLTIVVLATRIKTSKAMYRICLFPVVHLAHDYIFIGPFINLIILNMGNFVLKVNNPRIPLQVVTITATKDHYFFWRV